MIAAEKNRQMMKDPRSLIRPVVAGKQGPNLESVVIGGVAFYLDHEN